MSTHAPPPRRARWGPAVPLALIVVALLGVAALIESGRRAPARDAPAAPSPTHIAEDVADYRLLRHPSGPRRWIQRDGATVVDLPDTPQRVVSMSLGTDQILLEIVPTTRIRGVSQTAFDPRFSQVADQVTSLKLPVATNAEQVLAQTPDLVLAASYTPAAVIEQISSAGVPILRLTRFDSVAAIRANIRLIGFACGRDDAAAALIAQLDARIAAAQAKIPTDRPAPRVLWSGFGQVLGSGTTFDDAVRLAGAVNIPAAEGLKGWPKVSEEQIAAWDPDVIVISDDSGDADAAIARHVERHPVIATTRAARAGRIVAIPSRTMTTVSHHVAGLVEALVDALHGR